MQHSLTSRLLLFLGAKELYPTNLNEFFYRQKTVAFSNFKNGRGIKPLLSSHCRLHQNKEKIFNDLMEKIKVNRKNLSFSLTTRLFPIINNIHGCL